MTDRIRSVTVILDKDYRDDDVESILSAIRMVKGVDHVETSVVTSNDHINRSVVAIELRRQVFDAIDKALPIWPGKKS